MPWRVCAPATGTVTLTWAEVVVPVVANVPLPWGMPSRLMVTAPLGGVLPGLVEVTVPVTVMVLPPMGVVVDGVTTSVVGLGWMLMVIGCEVADW